MKSSVIFALGMVIVVVSFLGFITENVWLALTRGYIDNRNMNLPFLLGYGLAIVAIYLLLGTPSNMCILGKRIFPNNKLLRVIAYFLCVMLCVSIGEIVLGTFVEKTCNIIWWDYTRIPLHITRYTSIPTSIAFATLITLFMSAFFTPIINLAMNIDIKYIVPLCISSLGFLVADFINSAIYFYKHHTQKTTWRINVSNETKHNYRWF